MREYMRRTFDELWIVDLGGDSLGARKSENVFAIRVAVAIAIGVRYGGPHSTVPANVHYTRIDGSQNDKLAALEGIGRFEDLAWQDCATDWRSNFLPVITSTSFS